MKQQTQSGMESTIYYRGRYQTWYIICQDTWKRRPDGRRVFECRTCGTTCKRASTHFCCKACAEEWNKLIEYPLWPKRLEAIERDGGKCMLCGRMANMLEVDHIQPVFTHPELEFDLENLRTLCPTCHAKRGARPGKPGAKARRLRLASDGHELTLAEFGTP